MFILACALPGTVDISRLRGGEVASGVGGMLLLGWKGRRQFPVLRWLSLITGVSALALPYTQATRRGPALPVSLSVVVTALGCVTSVGLVARVMRRTSRKASGAHLGLLAAGTVAVGGYASMRKESGTDPAEFGELETITLEP